MHSMIVETVAGRRGGRGGALLRRLALPLAAAVSAWPASGAPAAAAASLPSEADWIVVGGGAGGCSAAAALADLREDVLILERGPSDLERPATQTAHRWPEVVNEATQLIRWTEGTWGAVAQVLGGGDSVNLGFFFEETPEFVEEVFGGEGVDIDEYFASSAFLAGLTATQLAKSKFGDAEAAALESAGLGTVNASEQRIRYTDGAWRVKSLFNQSEADWPRNGPAKLLHDRAGLPNLRIATGVTVKKINFAGSSAVGVEVAGGPHGANLVIVAKKGVVLSTGAIFTPQLLQISGVGEVDLLNRLGVPLVSPGLPVGQNFVDRLLVNVAMLSPQPIPHFIGYGVAASSTRGVTVESCAGGHINSELAKSSLGLSAAPQREAALRPLLDAIMATPIGDIIDQALNLIALMQNTHSRGIVEAVSQDASRPPAVTANNFGDPRDMEQQLANLKFIIEVAGQPSLTPYRTQKIDENSTGIPANLPDWLGCIFAAASEGVGFVSLPCIPEEASWEKYVRDTVLSSYHYFGTAAAGSVVEGADFAVKGTKNLYVADASVLPKATRINPAGTIMTIGHYVGKTLGRSAVPSRGPAAVREVCVWNEAGFIVEWSLLASSGGSASMPFSYAAGFSHCVDGSRAGAARGDVLRCSTQAVAGRRGDCSGGDYHYDAASGLRAVYQCTGVTWDYACAFFGLAPIAVQSVRRVCVRNAAGFVMHFDLTTEPGRGASPASSRTYSAGFTECLEGSQVGASQGDKLVGTAQAVAGTRRDLTGADLSFDAASPLQGTYRCAGYTLEFVCEFDGFSAVGASSESEDEAREEQVQIMV